MKTWTSSICAGVQQAAQHSAAAFDQHVGHSAPAQFVEQLRRAVRVAFALADEDLAAGVDQPVAIVRRRLVLPTATSTGTSGPLRTSWLSSGKRGVGVEHDARWRCAGRAAGRSTADRREGRSRGRR